MEGIAGIRQAPPDRATFDAMMTRYPDR
jgi:hypothetical protein